MATRNSRDEYSETVSSFKWLHIGFQNIIIECNDLGESECDKVIVTEIGLRA